MVCMSFQNDLNSEENKFWEDLITYFPFTTYWVSGATRTACKTQRPTFIPLLRVYSLTRESFYRAIT
jgi:hypothetical protein